ncbi:MAG: nicotinate-nicotinamide nucleotide adenylyltransferase, partial [archaeon]|nr:nicotinate-nicotinamide nucleotide adenylyltransferase [archaeon]
PTYTIDTILKVKELFPENDYFWLMGTDLIPEFESWKNPEKILKEARLILFPVPGTESNKNSLVEASFPIHVSAKEIDLSSTVVREKLVRGEDVSGLVQDVVLKYIKENNLYK